MSMLVATRTFTDSEGTRITRGRTRVREGHEPALSHPEYFRPVAALDGGSRSDDEWRMTDGDGFLVRMDADAGPEKVDGTVIAHLSALVQRYGPDRVAH